MSLEGWEKKQLGDVLILIRNGYSGQQVNQVTNYPITRIETISDGVIDLQNVGFSHYIPDSYKLKNGDILLSNINSLKHIGKVAYFFDEIILYHGMNLLLLRCNHNVNKEFIYYKLIASKKWFKKVATQAVNQASINQETIKKLSIEIPKNEKEQEKIAEVLSTVDRAIAQTEALIAKQQRIKTGLMQDLLTKGIDEAGNIRSEETHEFKDSPLGRIPIEWDVVTIGDIAYAIDPQPDHRTPPQVTGGVPYIGVRDFNKDETINFEGARKVSLKVLKKQREAFSIDNGDFVFGKIGTIGLPHRLPKQDNYTLSANVILIKPKETPSFVYWWMASPIIERQVDLEIHTTSQPAFGILKIRNLSIVKPSVEERIKIENSIESVVSTIRLYEKKLRKLKCINTGLMQDLLNGKVPVTPLLNK